MARLTFRYACDLTTTLIPTSIPTFIPTSIPIPLPTSIPMCDHDSTGGFRTFPPTISGDADSADDSGVLGRDTDFWDDYHSDFEDDWNGGFLSDSYNDLQVVWALISILISTVNFKLIRT